MVTSNTWRSALLFNKQTKNTRVWGIANLGCDYTVSLPWLIFFRLLNNILYNISFHLITFKNAMTLSDGFPPFYDSRPTSVFYDVTIAYLVYTAIALFIGMLLVLPGVRGKDVSFFCFFSMKWKKSAWRREKSCFRFHGGEKCLCSISVQNPLLVFQSDS